ncbi:hypothetical protein PSTT_00512 [Puccinia striiformis]|uniref:Uncharacterized protein n=1 Tax=Puccinia striiformis TaxID=27350 RepID=A0A2S4W7D3_9BASI|nr:hypothetical protein PSTT_00512 [Puccinia striiformis]
MIVTKTVVIMEILIMKQEKVWSGKILRI